MEVKEKLKKYLSRFFRKHVIQEDEDIFELGFVNSLFAMQLVMFIEKEFGVVVDNKDLDMENFKTVNSMVKLIEGKIA
ncbi:acyl carrier protein [Clostridium tagluense]|uniref:acyl carrier protein n=1 Tax=Clostridium tagluense TaxID=360422 RepID=UPI001CF2B80D|nr:acyl carrier protein [Clostridium tagluense]MCB2298655.1 acyl carrier protein [Clostridium tagluense]